MFGLLNLNKPAGCTSRDVVSKVARLVGRNYKVGHAGTLDPLATGVLVVCVGPATRLEPFIHEHQKSYEAEFILGCRSDTDDTDGVVEEVLVDPELSAEQIRESLPEFIGKIQQVPPAYSAVKVNGRRAYQVAREGAVFELAAREVEVSRLELTSFAFPKFSLSIDCGTGTYIRSIGRDLARKWGTEAVMSRLVRTHVGPFHVEDSADTTTLSLSKVRELLISPLVMLDHIQKVIVSELEAQQLLFGQTLPWPADLPQASEAKQNYAAISPDHRLVGMLEEKAGRLAPQIVFRMKE
ncbi:tRNA pseudouridine(55) synthase TruB [Planctomicrobium sp. SH668]|uniref:tRNA pseudouridine(55) synthase TruB n=1 Tax=Planctomicrobium sp. SH668 TaxID=3448126 RepID=UPI003F5B4466